MPQGWYVVKDSNAHPGSMIEVPQRVGVSGLTMVTGTICGKEKELRRACGNRRAAGIIAPVLSEAHAAASQCIPNFASGKSSGRSCAGDEERPLSCCASLGGVGVFGARIVSNRHDG